MMVMNNRVVKRKYILNINKAPGLSTHIFTTMNLDTINEVRSFVPNDDQLFFEQVCKSWKSNNSHSTKSSNIITTYRSDSQILEIVPYLTIYGEEVIVKSLAFKGQLKTLMALDNTLHVTNRVVCIMDFAARGGHLDIIRWLQYKGIKIDSSTCDGAAWGGHIDIIDTLLKDGIDSRNMTLWCVIGGQLETLKTLRSYGYTIPHNRHGYTCELACEKGNVEMVKYLIEEEHQVCDIQSYIQAVTNGHVGVLKYLIENIHSPDLLNDLDIMGTAAHYRQLEILKYLIQDGFPCTEFVMHKASLGGDINIVKFLHESGCEWDSSVYTGNIEIMQYAYDEGCPFSTFSCDYAASYGDIKALGFLKDHGCPWTENTIREAYRSEEYKTVKYLRNNGCPWPAGLPHV